MPAPSDQARTVVYTDGACLGNPGPGGWAWAVPGGRFASGHENPSTNQRMEISAAFDAVRSLDGPLEVVSDSTYVVNCFRDRWWEGWLARGWKNSAKKDVANQDLWKPFIEAYRADPTRIRFRWVKGHSGDTMNDLVDRLAVEAANTQQDREGAEPPTSVGPADRPSDRRADRPRATSATRTPNHGGDQVATIPGYLFSVTGLRPPDLGGYSDNPMAERVRARMTEIVAAQTVLHADLVVCSGLGLGAEQLGAQAALDAGVPLAAVLAFPGVDQVWPAASRQRFADLLARATHTVTLQSTRPTSKQQAGAALARRDEWLSRHSSEALVVWDGEEANVGRTVRSLQDRLGEEQVWILDPPVSGHGRLGVDTGGTFTDVVAPDGTVIKVPSTPTDPAAAVGEGVRRAGGADELAHGTTVATNALLERRGGRVALIASQGHADVIEIARQARPALYDPFADRPEPLVARALRLEVAGRLDADGKEITPLGAVPAVPDGVDVVAVSLLHADLDPRHEQAVARALGGEVVCSHQVSPEFRDYERTVTTVANAYLLGPCRAYLEALAHWAPRVVVMTSAGGLVPLHQAARLPVSLLLSGPAGGVAAAGAAARACGWDDCVTFDMGGTSTDVCLILGGRPEPAAQRSVAGFPIRMPSLDVHTIGAGGGSIARIDAGGALVVGPRSAGADPGPACYGRGGSAPTVTDADLVAGRMPQCELPGIGPLDAASARRALSDAGVDAAGVITVVDEAMVQAIRVVSVQRGVDPAGLALVAFGGAGPLHACALADALNLPVVIVPPRAGVLSTAGILTAPHQCDLVRSWPTPADHHGLNEARAALAAAACDALGDGDGVSASTSVDCRYAGQSHELSVPEVAAFSAEHQRRNGFTIHDVPIEVVAVRATARARPPVTLDDLPVLARHGRRRGPVSIAEHDCTVWVADGWEAVAHPSGSWVLQRESAG